MNYQRKTLPDSNLGDPGPLPANLDGLTNESLADLSAALNSDACAALGYTGQGFFPVADPTPTPPAPILSPYDFLLLFTSAERVAIRAAAASSGAVADWLDLLNHVPAVHLDDANTIAGVNALGAAGLIGTGRAAQILANQAP